MATDFSRTLSLLRQEKGISQRKAAAALGISQALLSHYENGIREPGLAFVCKVCDFYRVSADFLLGRTAFFSSSGAFRQCCSGHISKSMSCSRPTVAQKSASSP